MDSKKNIYIRKPINFRSSQIIFPKKKNDMMNIRNKVVIEESKKKENKNIFNDNPLCHRAIIHFRDNNKILLEFNFNKKEIEKEIEKENEKEKEKEKKNLHNYNLPLKKDKSIRSRSLIPQEIRKEEKKNIKKKEKKKKYNIDETFLSEMNIITPIHSLNINSGIIQSLDVFPSGNIIAVTSQNDIIICNTEFNIIQQIKIKEINEDGISYVLIKDEENFITASKHIKFWKLIGDSFEEFNRIENPHDGKIFCLKLYNHYQNLVSCSLDHYINFYEKNYNKYYKLITKIQLNCTLTFVRVNEKKKILINGSYNGIYLIDLNNYTIINYTNLIKCMYSYSYCFLNDEKFIVADSLKGCMYVEDISNNNFNQETIIQFSNEIIWGITYLKSLNLIIAAGNRATMNIYENITYKLIYSIQNSHKNRVIGIVQLDNKLIASFSEDSVINIWYINYRNKIKG